ncbi:MAG TPA: hypothetical protein VJG32_08470 [Anaerolineae bacterium]|nr:hypothetical protein [Anaerolineae bacterium]
MKRNILMGVVCLFVAGSLCWTSTARAESQATYQLVKSNVGPGASGSSGVYSVSSSVGQPDAGEVRAGIYTLGGGFWGGGIIVSLAARHTIYLPLVIR